MQCLSLAPCKHMQCAIYPIIIIVWYADKKKDFSAWKPINHKHKTYKFMKTSCNSTLPIGSWSLTLIFLSVAFQLFDFYFNRPIQPTNVRKKNINNKNQRYNSIKLSLFFFSQIKYIDLFYWLGGPFFSTV